MLPDLYAAYVTVHIRQMRRHNAKSLGENLQEIVSDLLVCPQKGIAVVNPVNPAFAQCTDRRGVRDVEQQGHFAKKGARIRYRIDLKIPFEDFDLAADQDAKRAGLLALGEQNSPRCDGFGRKAFAQFQDC